MDFIHCNSTGEPFLAYDDSSLDEMDYDNYSVQYGNIEIVALKKIIFV